MCDDVRNRPARLRCRHVLRHNRHRLGDGRSRIVIEGPTNPRGCGQPRPSLGQPPWCRLRDATRSTVPPRAKPFSRPPPAWQTTRSSLSNASAIAGLAGQHLDSAQRRGVARIASVENFGHAIGNWGRLGWRHRFSARRTKHDRRLACMFEHRCPPNSAVLAAPTRTGKGG
jgi:hypothetical protein